MIPKAIYYSSYDNGGVCPVTDPNYLLGPVGRTGKYHIRISTIDNEIDITSPIFNIPEERPIILPYAHMVPLEWIAYKGNHWNINWRVCGGMDENVRISLI